MVNTAIVLAGGLGTRLRSVLPDLPKPMAPVNDRPFLEYLMDYWITQGIEEFILSIGYLSGQIINHFGDCYRGCPVQYSLEEMPLGTGGAVLAALQRLRSDAPFLLLNGDTFFEVDLAALKTFHLEHASEWTFSMFRTSESGRYMGLEVDCAGRLTDIGSRLSMRGGLANGGAYLIDPVMLTNCGRYVGEKFSLESEMVPNAFDRGIRFFGFESDGRFIDIGVPEDYARALSVLRS